MPHCRARKFLYESVRNSCVHHSSRFVTECVKHSEDEIDERENGGVRFRASAHRHCGVGALSLAVRNGDMHAIGLHFRMRDDAFRSVRDPRCSVTVTREVHSCCSSLAHAKVRITVNGSPITIK